MQRKQIPEQRGGRQGRPQNEDGWGGVSGVCGMWGSGAGIWGTEEFKFFLNGGQGEKGVKAESNSRESPGRVSLFINGVRREI